MSTQVEILPITPRVRFYIAVLTRRNVGQYSIAATVPIAFDYEGALIFTYLADNRTGFRFS